MKKKKLIIIGGPTAVGKTQVSIELAKHYCTEILSCDSRQMYRELSIGTAVPDEKQLKEVKHHFIHSISIHDYYNAYMYEVQSLELLERMFLKYDIVLMTGGSGLYIDAVVNGIDDLPTIDQQIRSDLEHIYREEGIEGIRIRLRKIDPDYYNEADLKNPKRILKALEVYAMTGKPYSSLLKKEKKQRPFEIIMIGLNIDRHLLHERINRRVDSMVQNGLILEARECYGYKNLNSLNTVGYKELFDHFDGNSSLEESLEMIKRNTRRYARRQISWFKRYNNLHWVEPTDLDKIKISIEFGN